MTLLHFFSLTSLIGLTASFVPIAFPRSSPRADCGQSRVLGTSPQRPLTTSRNVLSDPSLAADMGGARAAFWLCFYGAAGVGSIGRELIPIVFGRYQSNKALPKTDRRPSAGGEDTGIWGYPQPVYTEDVEAILKNPMSADAIAKKYPSEKVAGPRFEYTHIEKSAFLTYEAFVLANPRANPVALRAVFDSFSNSIGGVNAISPISAQQRIDLYRTDVRTMASKLNSGKFIGIVAFLTLLVILGVADYLAIYHAWKGWFPEWRGFSNMPASLFDGETGILTLPRYFVGDLDGY